MLKLAFLCIYGTYACLSFTETCPYMHFKTSVGIYCLLVYDIPLKVEWSFNQIRIPYHLNP